MVTFRARGCHDCMLYGSCKDPKADPRTDYSCKYWEWRHG